MPIIFVFLCVTTHAFQGIWFDDIIWSAYHYLHCPKNNHKKVTSTSKVGKGLTLKFGQDEMAEK